MAANFLVLDAAASLEQQFARGFKAGSAANNHAPPCRYSHELPRPNMPSVHCSNGVCAP